MAAGKINLQANDGFVLGLYAPDGMGANTDIVPASVNGDATKVFKVADAVNADEALAKGQLLTEMKAVDGAGSGLDADLVRGLPADFTANLSDNGYQKLPNGLIIQWGGIARGSSTNVIAVNFPITFPNSCLGVVISSDSAGGSDGRVTRTKNIVTSGFSSVLDSFTNTTDSNYNEHWIAIGY